MAHIIPSDISRLALSGAHSPEVETLRVLKRQLPDGYTVFHGVHWTREYKSGTRFGEIDFVVLNRSGDVLFIEQKNGALEESGRGLIKGYDDGDKNVADQIARSMEEVLNKFQWQHGHDIRLNRDYLIYLPDYKVKRVNAVGVDGTRIVDASGSDGLARRIEELLGVGADDRKHFELVYEFFCQAFQVVPDIAMYRATHEKHFVRQVGPAAEILANLEMEPFRLRFEGTAGSGKSLLAQQFFAKQGQAGKRVLLVCFNRPLAECLRQALGDSASGYINNFHGFCRDFLRAQGHALVFPDRPDAAFWTRMQEEVSAQSIPADWTFDTLVVDEGQDFESEWLEILRLFVPEDAAILWLEDSAQNLYEKQSLALGGFVTYRCRTNYRTPETIARVIHDVLPVEFEPGNDLPGLGVGVHGYDDPEDQVRIVDRIIQDRVRQGFAHEDIVVVTCHGVEHSVFAETESIGGIPLRRPIREYDKDGNQVFTEGKIAYDSIYRYKGQQSPSVILVDVDPNPDRIERERKVLFCGMTRATVRLDIVARESNPENGRLFEGAGS